MKLLHESAYDVKLAKGNYDRVKDLYDGPTSTFSRKEARLFESTLTTRRKDFSAISRQMKRTRSDCLIHYYGWKKVSCSYREMKKDWKTDWCSVCDDGGDLIICDLCDLPYHLGCVSPPLDKIPKGDWYCPSCTGELTGARFSPSSPMASRRKARKAPTISATQRNNDEVDDGSIPDKDKTRKRLFDSKRASPLLSQDDTDRCIHSNVVGHVAI
jgi:hypothetical protein